MHRASTLDPLRQQVDADQIGCVCAKRRETGQHPAVTTTDIENAVSDRWPKTHGIEQLFDVALPLVGDQNVSRIGRVPA